MAYRKARKRVWFPEIARVKTFLSLTYPHCRICIKIYNFNFKKKTRRQKAKETKEEKKFICGKSNEIRWYRLWICSVYLLTYLIDSWISPGCSYEFNVVYVQREKFVHYNNIQIHTFKIKNKRKSLRDIFAYHFLFYICFFVAPNFL